MPPQSTAAKKWGGGVCGCVTPRLLWAPMIKPPRFQRLTSPMIRANIYILNPSTSITINLYAYAITIAQHSKSTVDCCSSIWRLGRLIFPDLRFSMRPTISRLFNTTPIERMPTVPNKVCVIKSDEIPQITLLVELTRKTSVVFIEEPLD